ncbi:MAG: GNAT family N-acetyltransferase, partial [Bdellovibrionales bacterium]|nr:GNAT family N-acetyltransferase [Bdellovibrionales bacterium]
HENTCCLGVPCENGSLKAFALGLLNDGTLDLIYIATSPRERQKGSALQLLCAYQNDLRIGRISLEVAEGNLPAMALYKAAGFVKKGVRRKYYENRYDALRLEWHRS